MTIGHKIKKVRELKGFTQETMAEKLSMSVQGYGKLERDETDLPYSRLHQIAEAFKMRVEDLVAFDERFVLNNYGEIKGNQIGLNAFPDELKRLYDDKVKLLEDKINYLQETVKALKEQAKK